MTHKLRFLALVMMVVMMTACEASPLEPTPTLFVLPTMPPLGGAADVTPTSVLGPTPLPGASETAVAEVLPSATPTEFATEENCIPDAEFDGDVTLPDGTLLPPGVAFTKTWRILNSGTCTWNSSYRFVFFNGDVMTGITDLPLPITLPGQTVDISINMISPVEVRTYTSTWRLIAPDGTPFGTQPYVEITVSTQSGLTAPPLSHTEVATAGVANSGSTPVRTPSAGASRTPTPLPQRTPTAGAATVVPTNRPAATGQPSTYPGISGVTYGSRQIFLNGKAKGNRANVFSKVGDSITVEWYFLGPIGEGYIIWDQHNYLSPVTNYFSSETAWDRNSFANTSFAATGGWPAWAVLDPNLANGSCGGKSPLECEYSVVRPSVALIMLGTNDVINALGVQQFEGNMQRLVQKSIDMGVIPVLYTLPWCVCGDVLPYNDAIIRTARFYDVPLVDYYTIMDQTGLNRGVRDDGIHPSVPPDGFVGNFDAEHLKYGYNIRNLMTLQVLDLLWRQVLSY